MQDDAVVDAETPGAEPDPAAVIHRDESTESAEAAIDALSDEQAAELAEAVPDEEEQLQLQVPLQSLDFTGANLRIIPHPDGSGQKGLVLGPILVQVIVPLSAEACRAVARQLNGGIEVARVVPPMTRRGRKG